MSNKSPEDSTRAVTPPSGFLEKNLGVFQERWPNLFAGIDRAPEPASVLLKTDTPESTLVIDGIHLSSGYDRMGEAQIQASLIPESAPVCWVYGVGLGDLPRVLLQRKTLRQLNVVVLNPAVARQSLKYFDHRDWLCDPRVRLLTAAQVAELESPFAAVPSCLQLADDAAGYLRDLVFLELATPFIREKLGGGNPQLLERIEENLRYVVADGDAGSLFGSQKNGKVLVAAAGPTLSDGYPWILQNRNKYPLIAVGSALKPLADMGVFPDAVIVIDPAREEVLRQFDQIDLSLFKDTPLVYFPPVHRDVLDLWPGPRLTAYPSYDYYRGLAENYPKQILYSSGTVLHPAVDLAVGMGAAEVMLFGADFAYPNGTSHVHGSAHLYVREENAFSHWVLDGFGNRVATSPDLRGFLRDLERYIAAHRGVKFINASKKGAFIKGTSYLQG